MDIYADIVLNELRRGSPVAQKTKIGWILFGTVPEVQSIHMVQCNHVQSMEDNLEEVVKRFMESEDQFKDKILTLEEQEIEEKFKKEFEIGPDNRFIVKLPFKMSPDNEDFLGDSYRQAFSRMKCLERQFTTNQEFYKIY